MTKYAFIGDVHSDIAELEALLKLVPTDYTLIFLGDLFDYRKPTGEGNALGVYRLIKSIPNAQVVRSNHQQKLLSYLRGNPVQSSVALHRTLVDFCLPGPKYHEELKEWLEAMPYALSLRCNNDEYRVSHGYYPDSLDLNNPTRAHKHECIYGLPKSHPKRQWWLHTHHYPYIKVCGHHHTIFTSRHSVILDGLCGIHEYGCLVAYLSDCKHLVSTRPLHKVPNMNSAYYYPSELGRPENLNKLA